MTIRSLLLRLIESRKKGPGYRVDRDVTLSILWDVISHRAAQALRGYLYKPFFRRCDGPLFVGRWVEIRNPRLISSGKNLTIKDGAFIQAMSKEGISFGNNVIIGRNTIIDCTGTIEQLGVGLRVGHNSSFGDLNYVGVRALITIGNNVLFGPRVALHAENHLFDRMDTPIRRQGVRRQGISIGDDCWIGSGVTILDGVSIGSGSVIAAGAVVTKSVPPLSVAAGVPARVVKRRD